MATVVITITDNEDGTVGVHSNPDVIELKKSLQDFVLDPEKIPPGSYNYAMRMLTTALFKSVENRTEKMKPQLSVVENEETPN